MRLSSGTLVPVAVVALSLISAQGIAAKCPGQIQMPGYEYVPGMEVVPLVDGLILTKEDWDRVDPSNIHSVEVTCWNPATGEFGGGVGVAVVLVLTKSFVEATRAAKEGNLRGLNARVLRDFYRMATTTKGGEDEPLSH